MENSHLAFQEPSIFHHSSSSPAPSIVCVCVCITHIQERAFNRFPGPLVYGPQTFPTKEGFSGNFPLQNS